MSSRPKSLVDLQNVTLKARGFGPIDLSFRVGEMVVLCGCSGSGKSTLCDLLSGLQEPSSGKLSLTELQVGYISHDYECQLIGSTVAEELELGSKGGQALEKPEQKLEQALLSLLSPLNDVLASDPQELPASIQQYVLLASIVKSGARFLILDESLSHLDPPSRERILDVLSTLAQAGLTILLVSHQPEILHRADRVLVLERGKLVYDGGLKDFQANFFERAGLRREAGPETFLSRLEPQSSKAQTPIGLRSAAGEMPLEAGRSTVIGGFGGAGSSRALNTLFGIDDLESWSLIGAGQRNCLLRQHLAPSFWRASCAQELEASRGAYSSVPKVLESTVLDSIPASWLEKPPWHLSHGQLRFFGASCLLLQMPQVLLLDHPFQGLDGSLRENLRESLNHFLQVGGRVVLTTHDCDEVARFGHQVIWLKKGHIEFFGPTESEEWSAFLVQLQTDVVATNL